MKSHEDMVQHLEQELDQHKLHPPDKHAKGLAVQNYKEKNSYLQSEVSLKCVIWSRTEFCTTKI